MARNIMREVVCFCCVLPGKGGIAGSLAGATGGIGPILARVVMSATAIDAIALMVATMMLAVATSNNAPFAALVKIVYA
jgi:hypothetical protein